ncbi:MAG: poly-gamma-glutamate hydrolase family protein [Gammaproteobacteria bacterium]
MTDIYSSFEELAQNHREQVDYRIDVRPAPSRFAIVAPHGGRIEHGTSQVARGIAGDDHACYCFEGLKPLSHDLHITSNKFDEPTALDIVSQVDIVVTVHGAYGKQPYVYFGGLHTGLKHELIYILQDAGFPAAHDPSPTRQGKGRTNICNRGQLQRGVQMEMTQGFRKSLFDKPDYNHTEWRPNQNYYRFTRAIREALLTFADE